MGIVKIKNGGTARTSGSTGVASLTMTVPAGGHAKSSLLVVAHRLGLSAAPTVTDSKGNTWATNDIGLSYSILSTPLVAGDTITVTCNATDGTSLGATMSFEFLGIKLTSPKDDAKVGSGTNQTSLSAGTLVTAEDNELLIAAFLGSFSGSGFVTNAVFTPGAGWTMLGVLDSSGTVYGLAVMWRLAPTAGNYTTPATVNFTRSYQARSIGFKREVVPSGDAAWV